MKLLDCTLRDGGYYNNWDFDRSLVEDYLNAMVEAKVNAVEIGFRSLPKTTFMGPYSYSLDKYLETLSLPRNALIGVMINASEFLNEYSKTDSIIDNLFQPAENSPIDLVRIAINFESALKAEALTKILREKGYKIGFNLMQSNGHNEKQWDNVVGTISKWDSVDILYFADSLGNMNPKHVSFICNCIKNNWEKPIGIHTHDNKGLALINSLTALEEGVEWCDSTIMGMGRGAGNVSTEALLMECNSLGLHTGDAQLLGKCLTYFKELKQDHQWGSNPHYHYGANHNIHPTYVQSLLSDNRYSNDQIHKILEFLASKPSTSFNKIALREAVYPRSEDLSNGSWDATGWLEGKEVLMIGSGPSVKKYRDAIIAYIKNNDCAVLFLNINEYIPSEYGFATIVAHENRAIFDASQYSKLGHPIVMPFDSLGKELSSEVKGLEILNYGVSLQENTFKVNAKNCILPIPLAFAYGLCVAVQANAREIKMVGFDGYDSNDPRQQEMNQIFAAHATLKNSLPLKSLTPTNYPIEQGSIFAPDIKDNEFVVVIPARYESSRFPGKPLVDLCGKSVIRWVWEKCVHAVGEDLVVVATDDKRIEKHCHEFGMKVLMTSKDCLTGTDRICEVAKLVERDFYINVQGDEPLIDSEDILAILDTARSQKTSVINGMCPIKDEKDFRSPNVPKVISSPNGDLLYMSRAPIPTGKKNEFAKAYRQVCIYSFPRNALLDFGKQPKKSPVEEIEDIEILRFLEMGYSVKMIDLKGSDVAIDTEEDLQRARKLLDY